HVVGLFEEQGYAQSTAKSARHLERLLSRSVDKAYTVRSQGRRARGLHLGGGLRQQGGNLRREITCCFCPARPFADIGEGRQVCVFRLFGELPEKRCFLRAGDKEGLSPAEHLHVPFHL